MINWDGVVIFFFKIKVDGIVDVNKVGMYKVIYMYDLNEGIVDVGKKEFFVIVNI